jgi:hypothetical protein
VLWGNSDVGLRSTVVDADVIHTQVTACFNVAAANFRERGHRVGSATFVALELIGQSARCSNWQAVGQWYGESSPEPIRKPDW